MTFSVKDNTIFLTVSTLGFDWESGENYLAYFLFDTDRDVATGDVDFAQQYQLGPDVILVLQPSEGSATLSLQTNAGQVPLAPEILKVDGGTLTLAIPGRYLSKGDFEFVFFVLGADAVKDRFPDDARLHFPSGEILPNS